MEANSNLVKYWLVILGLITSFLLQQIEGCGGCASGAGSSEAACRTSVKKTRTVAYYTGWWTSRKLQYKQETYYELSLPYCCSGYILQGSQCVTGCGGCASSLPSTQSACSQDVTITRQVSYQQSYSCGSWWQRRTCYRRQYRTVTATDRQYSCCPGFTLAGSQCFKSTSGSSCGHSKYQDAGGLTPMIVGGTETRKNEFPWQVMLAVGSTMCGGSIIHAEWVITAAHCVMGKSKSAMRVRAGEHNLMSSDGTEQARSVSNIHVHPAYDGSRQSDMALLRLTSPLSLNKNVAAICLPASSLALYDKTVIISGWGRIQPGLGTSSLPTTLQYTTVKVTYLSVCRTFFGSLTNLICATDGAANRQRSACFGDSGGPMVLKVNGAYTLVGVAAFVAQSGCATGYPFGYTEVYPYLNWISLTSGI